MTSSDGLTLKDLSEFYKDIPVYFPYRSLKEVYFDVFKQIAEDNSIEFPPHIHELLHSDSYFQLVNTENSSDFLRKKLKPLLKDLNTPLSSNSGYLQGLLCESVLCLEKSVYWFFNYRFNQRYGFLLPARQALYYSEFFSIIGLSRFLGLGFTYFPSIGPLIAKVQWETGDLKITTKQPKGRGDHKKHYNLLKTELERFPFISADIKAKISQKKGFILTEERVSAVYNFESLEKVFEYAQYGNIELWEEELEDYKTWCFLGGEEGLTIPHIHSENTDPDAIHDQYASWGYREHIIGIYQQELIHFLKYLPNKSIGIFLSSLKEKIQNIPNINPNEKEDLLAWLS